MSPSPATAPFFRADPGACGRDPAVDGDNTHGDTLTSYEEAKIPLLYTELQLRVRSWGARFSGPALESVGKIPLLTLALSTAAIEQAPGKPGGDGGGGQESRADEQEMVSTEQDLGLAEQDMGPMQLDAAF